VERGEEKVTRAVTGEEAAGPVGAVGGGGEAEDDDPCCRVAEAGDGTAPVGLARVGGPLLAGDLLAPGDEPRAAPARDDLALQRDQLLLLWLLPDFFLGAVAVELEGVAHEEAHDLLRRERS
jgi:hypothetical protein